MARLVSPRGISSPPANVLADFYRQEFIRHRECLAAQREYFSERAFTNADQALARILAQLEQLCAQADGAEVISELLRKFNAVTNLSGWSDPSQFH